jgi:hypothetical protein
MTDCKLCQYYVESHFSNKDMIYCIIPRLDANYIISGYTSCSCSHYKEGPPIPRVDIEKIRVEELIK